MEEEKNNRDVAIATEWNPKVDAKNIYFRRQKGEEEHRRFIPLVPEYSGHAIIHEYSRKANYKNFVPNAEDIVGATTEIIERNGHEVNIRYVKSSVRDKFMEIVDIPMYMGDIMSNEQSGGMSSLVGRQTRYELEDENIDREIKDMFDSLSPDFGQLMKEDILFSSTLPNLYAILVSTPNPEDNNLGPLPEEIGNLVLGRDY